MSPATALEQLETRAHLAMADVSRARAILREPRNPKAIAQAWRLVAAVRVAVAFADSDLVEHVADSDTFPLVLQILQLSHDKVLAFARQALEAGMGSQDWFHALREAIDALADALEGFYLARDPEFRTIIADAIRELSPASETSDWRATPAAMPD